MRFFIDYHGKEYRSTRKIGVSIKEDVSNLYTLPEL
jgi:hypothetical protein